MPGNGNDDNSPPDISHLFRREGAVSVADLRVDVAGNVSRTIADDETIALETKTLHARGDFSIARASRTRQVDGDYERHVEEAETLMIGAAVEEQVGGGVDYTAQVDADHIVGGAYVNTIAGPYLRIAAWADFLCWGGWLEADVARIEVAGVMIRSYMSLAHAAGARVTAANKLVDDFLTRTETFGTLVTTTGQTLHLSSPGGGMEMES